MTDKDRNEGLPADLTDAFAALGERLRVARIRRNRTLVDLADAMGASKDTLTKIEAGDASVSLRYYGMALHAMGLAGHLAKVADPADDLVGLEADLKAMSGRLRVRRRPGPT